MDQLLQTRTGIARSTAAAFVHALPAITLVAIELWLALAVMAWCAALLLGGAILTFSVAAIVLSVPGIWSTWHLVRLAVEAERHPG